jgi:acyl-CoA oxidase
LLPLPRAASLPTFPQASTAAAFPPAASDVFHLDDLLTPGEREVRRRARDFMEREVAPVITPYWERAEVRTL